MTQTTRTQVAAPVEAIEFAAHAVSDGFFYIISLYYPNHRQANNRAPADGRLKL